MNLIFRLLLLPFGLFKKLLELAIDGSRDIFNKFRFNNSKIDNGCCINKNSKIAAHCHVYENTLFLNSSMQSYSYIGRNSIVQNAHIGAYCSIANEVFIGLGTHPVDKFSTSPIFYRVNNPLGFKLVDKNSDFEEYKKIYIGNDVWIGARATVLDGVSIGDGAVVGAGAIVTKDVPPYAVVVGTPAKIVK